MIDFTSLFIIAGVLFGLLAGDAVMYGDTLRVQIAVAQNVSNAGFTEASAESVFMAEAARLVRGDSVIPAPTLRVNADPSVITALAKPLNLDSVVAALQNQLGIDHLLVSGAVLAEPTSTKATAIQPVRPLTSGPKLDMVIVVVQPHRIPVQAILEQPDGDATTLVRRAAGWAMEQVSPYRVVLARFLAGVQGSQDELAEAKTSADRFLASPWNPLQASARAMTHNVLALLAMLDNRIADAEAQIVMTEPIPDVLPLAVAAIALNHAFLAVALQRPDDAAALLRYSQERSAGLELPNFATHLTIMEGLVAWSNGDVANAEGLFRKVIAAEPDSATAHHYLGLLLRAKDDARGAAAEEAAERVSHRFERRTQALATLWFWTDPVKGGVTRRR